MRPRQRPSDGDQRSLDLKQLLDQVPGDAIFSHSGVEEYVSTLSESEIKVSINAISNSEIVYMLAMPFSKISSEGISAMSTLSVGIVSGYFDMPSSPMNNQSGGRSGGGMSGGNRPGGMANTAMSTPVKIWFQVDLFE